jgi:hypothetical protein
METVLAAMLATLIELFVVVLIVAPRWTLSKLKAAWRRLLYGATRGSTTSSATEPAGPATGHLAADR